MNRPGPDPGQENGDQWGGAQWRQHGMADRGYKRRGMGLGRREDLKRECGLGGWEQFCWISFVFSSLWFGDFGGRAENDLFARPGTERTSLGPG